MFIDHLQQNNDDFTQYTVNLDHWLGDKEQIIGVTTPTRGHIKVAAGPMPDKRGVFIFAGARDHWVGDDSFDVVVHSDSGQKKTLCFTISIRETCAL